MSIDGKHVILTGGSGGVGRFLTAGLAAKGARVSVLDLDDLPQEYANTRFFKCDLADGNAIAQSVKDATEAFGDPTILVHAAAYQPVNPFEELPFSQWRKSFAVNVDALYHLVQAVLPYMKTAGWGRIVSLTSTTVNEGMPNHCDYVASKAAIIGASRVLARELGKYGITVNCHSLGLTRTPMSTHHVEKQIALGLPDFFRVDTEQSSIHRVLEPQDHVGPILFLLSEEAGMISGQTQIVDGGRIFT